MTEIRVPTLGESVTEATVATWFKKPGEVVSIDEMICELETDKVTVEVPAPISGTLSEIIANEGETVAVDALLAVLNASKENKLIPETQQKSDNDDQDNNSDENSVQRNNTEIFAITEYLYPNGDKTNFNNSSEFIGNAENGEKLFRRKN